MQFEKQKKKPGAGIVVVKYFGKNLKVLGLMDEGFFDLPKGSMEPGESIIQTALRETEEESGITYLKFSWGLKHISLNNLTIFIAETDEDAVIKPNPITGKFEHKFSKWLQFDEQYFKPKLRPAIIWAKKIVNGGNLVDL